jgi:hypothetical protein
MLSQRALKELDLSDDGSTRIRYEEVVKMEAKYPYFFIRINEFQVPTPPPKTPRPENGT